jgi:hypothetical protein
VSSYAGVTFDEVVEDDGSYLYWTREQRINHIPIPGGTTDYIVGTGTGNHRLKLTVAVPLLANVATLVNAVSATTARTLIVYGETLANVYLVAAGEPRRVDGTDGWYEIVLEFSREA